MSVEDHKAIVRRWIEEGWNQGDVDIVNEIYAAGFIARGSVADAAQELRGPEALREFVLRTRAAFPDIHFTTDHLIAESDKVVGVFTVRGTHRGEIDGVPPTGKSIVITAVDVWRFEHGRIVERCLASIDRLDLMQQLGLISRAWPPQA